MKRHRDHLYFLAALIVFAAFMAFVWCATPGGVR